MCNPCLRRCIIATCDELSRENPSNTDGITKLKEDALAMIESLEKQRELGLLSGKSNTVTASLLYAIHDKKKHGQLTQKVLARVAKITEVTIRKNGNLLKNTFQQQLRRFLDKKKVRTIDSVMTSVPPNKRTPAHHNPVG